VEVEKLDSWLIFFKCFKIEELQHIIIQIENHRFNASIFDTPTGRAILEALPFQTSVNTWGDEIYFHISAQAKLESGAKAQVDIGDLAYWPTMPAFCIFFGPTPASFSDEPRAAGAVNVFGRLMEVDIPLLRSVKNGGAVKVHLDSGEN
jgi:hypothetical protein